MDNPPSFIMLYALLLHVSELHDMALTKKTGCLQPVTRERKAGTQGQVCVSESLDTQSTPEFPVLIPFTKGI